MDPLVPLVKAMLLLAQVDKVRDNRDELIFNMDCRGIQRRNVSTLPGTILRQTLSCARARKQGNRNGHRGTLVMVQSSGLPDA